MRGCVWWSVRENVPYGMRTCSVRVVERAWTVSRAARDVCCGVTVSWSKEWKKRTMNRGRQGENMDISSTVSPPYLTENGSSSVEGGTYVSPPQFSSVTSRQLMLYIDTSVTHHIQNTFYCAQNPSVSPWLIGFLSHLPSNRFSTKLQFSRIVLSPERRITFRSA